MPHCGPLGHTREVPEGLEVEIYRRAATAVVGRRIEQVEVDERIAGPGVVEATTHPDGPILGATVTAVDRIGKLLLMVLDHGDHTLGLHFGMTGRIVVDDRAPIDRLEYGGTRDDPAWDRLRLTFVGGGVLRINDPRRWARCTLDPDTRHLGPDLLDLSLGDVRDAAAGRSRSLKGVLLDQGLIAGLGNLCVDEVLWHAGLAPSRPAGRLSATELVALHRALREQLPAMLARGGSHCGIVSPALRAALPACPLDGSPLHREKVAGRTTVWCGRHQT